MLTPGRLAYGLALTLSLATFLGKHRVRTWAATGDGCSQTQAQALSLWLAVAFPLARSSGWMPRTRAGETQSFRRLTERLYIPARNE